MGERDTYQIVLQLKDELSSNLKQVNSTLQQTRDIGQKTAEGVSGFTSKIKSAIQPIRDFSRMMSSLMAAGGLVALFMRVANAVGDMEKAYAKLHPESQKAAGSLAAWNEAMLNLKAQQGEIVATLLGPIREAFISMLDPVGAATREMKNFNTELGKLVDKYKSDATKKLQDHAAMMSTLTMAQERYRRAVSAQVYIERDLADAQESVNTAMKSLGLPGASEAILKAQQRVEILQERLAQNKTTLEESAILMREIPQILREQADKAKTTADVTVKISDAEKLMNEYLKENLGLQILRLETAQEYMDTIDRMWKAPTGKGAAAGATTFAPKIGRTATAPFQAIDIELAAQLAVEGEELARINNLQQTYIGNTMVMIEKNEELADSFDNLGLSLLQDALVGVAEAFGQAVIGAQSLSDSMAQLISSILRTLGPLMIQKGLEVIVANPALGLALIAAGGLSIVGGAAFGAGTNTQGIPNPNAPRKFATGGVVTEPTLALLGERGPEAVVPLNPYSRRGGRSAAGIGGITIVAPNARYLDGRTAAQLVRQGLVAMRS
ncbi:MAG: hypothetical protein PHO67_08405 [Candidatus Omnitrophica bacterium]|nr:hypothetical protein [Candidatus Omnitrophota bacterium]